MRPCGPRSPRSHTWPDTRHPGPCPPNTAAINIKVLGFRVTLKNLTVRIVNDAHRQRTAIRLAGRIAFLARKFTKKFKNLEMHLF